MHLFVYEFTSAAAPAGPKASSLRTEGRAMLAALLEDFSRIPGVVADAILGAASDAILPAGVAVHRTETQNEETLFRRLASAADGTLVIAPEIDGVLADRLRLVEEAGGRLLGPTSAAARLTGDKLLLAEHLRQRGVPTPATVRRSQTAPSFPSVCKPRLGAGSQEIYLIRNEDEWRKAAAVLPSDGIVQLFVPGVAASVAFLIGPGLRLALPAAAQHLSTDGRFRYLGGSLPLPAPLAERATRIAARAVDSVKGLRGYVGVDVVLGPAADGGDDFVIEINARLTTSYIGLKALAEFNLAAAMLAVAAGDPLAAWKWRSRPVWFTPDGRVDSGSCSAPL
jgi:predicted ATP-grasp superfamily ATP-dependent carboligase